MDFATPTAAVTVSLAALASIALLVMAGYRGFLAWIAFKRAELELRSTESAHAPTTTSRIELADLKERLRKLEAIASGVSL